VRTSRSIPRGAAQLLPKPFRRGQHLSATIGVRPARRIERERIAIIHQRIDLAPLLLGILSAQEPVGCGQIAKSGLFLGTGAIGRANGFEPCLSLLQGIAGVGDSSKPQICFNERKIAKQVDRTALFGQRRALSAVEVVGCE
jgi:hypothetical protein